MKRTKTPEELRDNAEAVLAAAEERARAELERGEDDHEKLHRRADKLELEQRVKDERTRLTQEAAEVAQRGIAARRAGDVATREAVEQAAVRAELDAQLGRVDGERRRLLDHVEALTAAGRVTEAATLEKDLDGIDPEAVRERLAVASKVEAEARDRAPELEATVEKLHSEAAELRRELECVEEPIREEMDGRRVARAAARATRLFMFDKRELAHAAALQAGAELLLAEEREKRRVDSSSALQPGGPTIEVDRDGRLLGVAGLIPR